MSELTKKFDEIDALIRDAQWKKAAELLQTLKIVKGSEEELLRFASLARRSNLSQLALNTLRPYVRPSGRKKSEASDKMKAEYAANLVCLGICTEPARIFETISLTKVPEAYQMKAILHMRNWNYREAIPILEWHIQNPNLSEYGKLVGSLNLAMSHLYEEEYAPAVELLNNVLTYEGNSSKLLKGNAYRLFGNLEYLRGDYQQAIHYFQKSKIVFETPSSTDSFYVDKWMTLCRFALDKSVSNFLEIQNMIQRARSLRDWESHRDFDYQTAVLTQDEGLILKVYFGTPFLGYRARILRKFPNLKIPSKYLWAPPGARTDDHPKQISLNHLGLKPGQAHHRFLFALSSDFYRPLTVIDFHDKVFPDTFYNQGHSEQIVYKALNRLRSWMSETKLPLAVESSENAFFLRASGPCEILLEQNANVTSTHDFRLNKLREVFGEKPFSIQEAAEALELSKRSVNSVLKEGIESSRITVSGKSTSTRYTFKGDALKRAA